MRKLRKPRRPRTLSVDKKQPEVAFKVALLWGLLGCTGLVAADDEAMPDIEFLEYLGSWEESDADWVLFSEVDAGQVAADSKRTDPVSKDEESVETDDES